MERLDKILAGTGRWSRREVKELVCQGRVRVDGQTARTAEEKVDPEAAAITVDGQPVETERFAYVMLHKPAGVLSATEDTQQQTVLDLLPGELRRRGLSPVGRLDKDTEGLLLLTNDGLLAHRLLAPRSHVDKVYYARVEGALEPADAAAFAAGMTLGGWTGVPARRAGDFVVGGVPGDPAGGEVPPGEADAGGPGKAGDVPEAAVHGSPAAGPGAGPRGLPDADGGGEKSSCGLPVEAFIDITAKKFPGNL